MSAAESGLKLNEPKRSLARPSKKPANMTATESGLKLNEPKKSLEKPYVNYSLEEFPHGFNDEKDTSRHPSYTRFSVPYNIVCARRYTDKKLEYEKQFQHEIHQLINFMDSGASAVTFGRHIAYTSLWPPMHTRVEIKNTEKYFRLNKKQEERLTYLMENVIT